MYYYGNCYGYDCTSNWDRWGRWIVAGLLIFLGLCILVFVLFLNRRRRRRGMSHIHPRIGMSRRTHQPAQPPQPEVPYGSGGGAGGGGIYNQNMGYQQYAPPPGPPPQYGSGLNADYYGQTPEVSHPQNAYQPPYVK